MKVEGGEDLARKLNALPEALSKNVISAALKSGGERVRTMAAVRMKRSADPPHAADNVVMSVGRSGRSIAIGPSKSFFYWLFQEFGTVRHPAQPALRPAFDSQAPVALGIIGEELWNALRKVAGQGSTRTSGGGGGLL